MPTGRSSDPDGLIKVALGDPTVRSCSVVERPEGDVSPGCMVGAVTCDGSVEGAVEGAEVDCMWLVPGTWLSEVSESDRMLLVGLTKMPSEPRTYPGGGFSSGGK